jgi:hypothetical protein
VHSEIASPIVLVVRHRLDQDPALLLKSTSRIAPT